MHAYELDEEVVSVLANRKHSAESPASPVAAIGPHSANGPAAALLRCRTPQRLHTHFLVPRSVECASGSLCSNSTSSSRSSSPGSILHEQHQRHQHPPRLQQQQQQQQPLQQQPLQQQPLQQQPLQQQEDARRLMKSRSLQGSPNPSAPHPWGLPGRNGKPFPLSSRRSAEPVCTPDLHARRHEPHVSESSSVRSSTSSSNMSCHRAPPKRSVTSSPLPGHTGPSSLPICNSLPNLGCRATSPPRQLAHRAKAGSLMHTPPQLQQRQKQQARAAPRQPPSQGPIKWPVPPARATSSSSAPRCAQEVASSSCPNSPFAVTSQPQRQWKRFAQDGTLSATILARAEEKLHELAALEGEKTSYPDSQGQAQMGPPSTGSPANFGGSAVQRHLQLSRSEASLFSLPAAAHKTTQHHFVQPDCAQPAAKTELDHHHHQQQQQQQGSNTAGALASADLNAPADLDPAINDADALKLCLGMLRGTGRPPSCSDKDSSTRKSTPRLSPLSMSRYSRANTHSLNQPMDSSGSPADGSKAGSRLSRHAGCGTLGDSGPREGGRGPRPWEGIQAAYKAAPASAAHHDKAATTSHAHHKVVALQGSPSGSDLSSWRSCSSLLPSECSADSLTYQEQPQLYHNLCNAMQCRSQDGLQLVDGARRRARRRSNMCNAKALCPLQDGASAASGLSPRSSPPRMPHQKQSTKCLCATNAVAFDEEAAELAEREYMAVSQKAHGSLDSESPEFMMAVAQLQAYRPIFIAPDRKPKAAKPGNTAAGPAGPKSDREEIEEIIRTQHEEAIARMLNGKDARQSRCTGPPKQQQCRPEERCASMEPKKEVRSDRKQVLQEVVADMESESTDDEQGVSEAEDAVSVAGELADEKQEEAVAAPPAAPAAEEWKQPAVAATAAATVHEMVNEPQSPPAEKEPWKLWKMTTSDDVEGGVALESGEFPADRKPPLWKPWRPLDLEHVGGWGSKESPADEKPSPWKPVRPLNPDHYDGSWGSKKPPADKKPPTWKPVQPCNPDHYDGSWDSKSPERSGSPAVSPVPWKPFWHTNPVDLSDLRPIDGSEKKGKPLQPMWRL